jgi:hypothetical protein
MDAYGFADLKSSPKQEKLPYDQRDRKAIAGPAKVQGSRIGPIEDQAGTEVRKNQANAPTPEE